MSERSNTQFPKRRKGGKRDVQQRVFPPLRQARLFPMPAGRTRNTVNWLSRSFTQAVTGRRSTQRCRLLHVDHRQSWRKTTREAERSISRRPGDDGRSMRDDRAEAQCSLPSGSPLVAIDAQRSPSPFPALHPASSSLSATPGRKAGLNAKAARGTLQCVPVPNDCRPDVRHHRTSSHRGESRWPTAQVSLSGRHGTACRQSDGRPQACRRLLHAFSRPRRCGRWRRESAVFGTKARTGKEP